MSRVSLDETLREDYQQRFQACVIEAARIEQVDVILSNLQSHQTRYQRVGNSLGIPWYVVAILHYLENASDFSVHLHNGDPLAQRTVHEPAERPLAGNPPFSWEASAVDALQQRLLDRWSDWSLTGTLFKLEAYHGWQYRLREPSVPSPYLWSFSNHYQQGKWISGDLWNDNAVADYCGGAVLLRRLAEQDLITLEPMADAPLIRAQESHYDAWVAELQHFLNRLPGIFVRIDGRLGPRTSKALRRAIDHRLLSHELPERTHD